MQIITVPANNEVCSLDDLVDNVKQYSYLERLTCNKTKSWLNEMEQEQEIFIKVVRVFPMLQNQSLLTHPVKVHGFSNTHHPED